MLKWNKDIMSDQEEIKNFQKEQNVRLRISLLLFFIFLLFTILAVKLWDIQVIRTDEYKNRAQQQTIRKIRIPPVRGCIRASGGEALALNRTSWNVFLYPAEMGRSGFRKKVQMVIAAADSVAACIGRENTLDREKIERHLHQTPGLPIELFRDLNERELTLLWEMMPHIQGLEISEMPVRMYPFDTLAVHILGHTRKSDPSAADDRREFNYYVPDIIGVEGIEALQDEDLGGDAGSEIVIVNSAGYVTSRVEGEGSFPALNGNDVWLTLDLSAQQIVEDLLRRELVRGRPGAMVVLDAQTGAVVAMASSPSFSYGDFKSRDKYNALNENPDKPFLNRCTRGIYLPGSVIKPLCAIATLENGISPEDTVYCAKKASVGYGSGIKCTGYHRDMDAANALKHSCNVYFVENAARIGIDALSEVYATAGIGRKTGIDIPENAGFLPKRNVSSMLLPILPACAELMAHPNEFGWNKNETAYVGFGQGKVGVTPLQVAVYYAALANGGYMLKPFLVDCITPPGESREKAFKHTDTQVVGRLAASPETLKIVRSGLFKVVNEDGGSGQRARLKKTVIYGKTGTADVETEDAPTKNVWFAGFASHPVTGKTYSIAVMIERGDFGGTTCAPLVREFFDRFFPDMGPEDEEVSEGDGVEN